MANTTQIKTSLDLVSLDFDTQKQSLVSFLKGQELFKDYDFTGSNFNVLLDILTYNTLKNAFFLNMNMSESFIDSAQLRDSILSHAKALNYTPRSAKSARATVKVDFEATSDNQPYVIQKGQSFSTIVKNSSYVFSIPETLIVSSSNNTFSFETDIYEGIYLKDTYVFTGTLDNERFRITNRNVDTSSITVTVYEDNSLNGERYTKTDTLLDLTDSSKVYFLQASEKGFYEIVFGDNITGYQPKLNSTIVIDYRVSSFDLPNGAKRFFLNFDPTGVNAELANTPEVTTITNADGGTEPETNESIRYYAPRHFQMQQRTVIPSDYEIALKSAFPEINAVSAYGGEDADPPQYGSVFIAVDLREVDGFPDSKKDEYATFIRKRSALRPVFIDPQFTYFGVKTIVRYNINTTTSSRSTIKTLVADRIAQYNEEHLNDFGVTLRESQFASFIDGSDTSIISNITDVTLYKKLNPTLGKSSDYQLEFAVELENDGAPEDTSYAVTRKHSVFSDVFTLQGLKVAIEDDNEGTLRLVKIVEDVKTVLYNIGTVDYTKGLVTINKLTIDSYTGSSFKIYVIPSDRDITIAKNTIGAIENDQVNITVEAISV